MRESDMETESLVDESQRRRSKRTQRGAQTAPSFEIGSDTESESEYGTIRQTPPSRQPVAVTSLSRSPSPGLAPAYLVPTGLVTRIPVHHSPTAPLPPISSIFTFPPMVHPVPCKNCAASVANKPTSFPQPSKSLEDLQVRKKNGNFT